MFKGLGHWLKQIFGSSKPDQPRVASLPQSESNSQMAEQFDSIDAASHLVPYDENLLERARTQWQFGDWQSLANLDRDTLQHHPERAKLILLAAAGRLQIGKGSEARQYIRLAQDWGCSKKHISQILIAGVHNSIGRAAALGNQRLRALQHFENAITIGTPGSESRLLTQARTNEQLSQLDDLNRNHKGDKIEVIKSTVEKTVLPDWIIKGLQQTPNDPALLIAAAEIAQRGGYFDSAIRYWQRLAASDGAVMQQVYYERLTQAYKEIKSFPKGTADQETLRGDMDKHLLLKKIHQLLQPRGYLEIGVQAGRSLKLAECPAIGIDPMPMMPPPVPENVKLVHASSDIFFAQQAFELDDRSIDLVFIDGMHLFEYALRDFINLEKYANHSTLVVIDDILPGHPAQALRDRRTRAWTGDVWKLLPILRQHRPDLSLLLMDAHPTGLLCISRLDPKNTTLQKEYGSIASEWAGDISVPNQIISRAEAVSCAVTELEELLSGLRTVRVKEVVNLADQGINYAK